MDELKMLRLICKYYEQVLEQVLPPKQYSYVMDKGAELLILQDISQMEDGDFKDFLIDLYNERGVDIDRKRDS